MSDLLGIATSGLMAFQRALSTTGHNISNVDTPGFSRQRVSMSTRMPQQTGSNYLGTGVDIAGVERIYDAYKVEQVRVHTSLSKELETYYDLAAQIDNLVADPEAGLAPALQDFFGSVQDVSDNPSSVAARQVMISNGESLAGRFQSLNDRLDDAQESANRQLYYGVAEINSLSQSIAELNRAIASTGSGGKPNDLLDERDHLIERLSEYVSVSTVEQDNGAVNVFIGKGQSLVLGDKANTLSLRTNEYLPYHSEIVIDDSTGGTNITPYLSGGVIGGVYDFQEEILEPTRSALGRVAAGLSESFNAQHRDGLDLNNNLGGDFFQSPSPISFGSAANTNQTVAPTLGYSDVSKLTTDDYMLIWDGAAWQLTNTRTNQAVAMTGTGTDADPFIADGMSISVQPIAAAAGDTYRFMLRPTAHAARDIEMAIADPEDIAAAGALRVSEATDVFGAPVNTGTGTISDVSMDDDNATVPLPLGGDIVLTYDSVAMGFNLAGPGAPHGAPAPAFIPYDPVTDDGQVQTVNLDGIDISFRLGGTPQNGDQFLISDNLDAVSDNENAARLAQLETTGILNNGASTLQSAYAQMVGDVGAKTRQTEINAKAEATLLDQAIAARESVSGVNLDEEAANLIEFQQAYEANAKLIATAQALFDALLNAIGR